MIEHFKRNAVLVCTGYGQIFGLATCATIDTRIAPVTGKVDLYQDVDVRVMSGVDHM
jgi:hypothetical protein